MKAKEAIVGTSRNNLEEYDDPPQDVRLVSKILYLQRNFLSDLLFQSRIRFIGDFVGIEPTTR